MKSKLKEIKDLIESKQLTQKEVAKKIGVNHIHLNAVLKERKPFTDDLYHRLKYHLNQ